MAIIRWLGEDDASSQFESAQREMERWFGSFRSFFNPMVQASVYPPINMYDDGESTIVRAEVPGVEPKNLDVSVQGDTLTIRGKREIPEASDKACYHRQERSSGEFRRAFTLPTKVDTSKVMANTKNGILEIRLPHAPESKQRRIEVKPT